MSTKILSTLIFSTLLFASMYSEANNSNKPILGGTAVKIQYWRKQKGRAFKVLLLRSA